MLSPNKAQRRYFDVLTDGGTGEIKAKGSFMGFILMSTIL